MNLSMRLDLSHGSKSRALIRGVYRALDAEALTELVAGFGLFPEAAACRTGAIDLISSVEDAVGSTSFARTLSGRALFGSGGRGVMDCRSLTVTETSPELERP